MTHEQPSHLINTFRELTPRMVADALTLIGCESPSDDLDAVAQSAQLVAKLGTRLLGVKPDLIRRQGHTHLRWRLGTGGANQGRVLLLGHHDTVWPVGTLERRPAECTKDILRGPGCFDMKVGVVMAFYAAAALPNRDGLSILITGDEEIGSPTSRQLIEDEALDCAAVLVLEAAADDGSLKTERKGVSLYTVHAHGRSAHAGLAPGDGVNATIELAHQILAVADLADSAAGTTVTPTVTSAGVTTNTVPDHGLFRVDVRARTAAEQQRVHQAITSLSPITSGSSVSVDGGPNRAPLERTSSQALFRRAAAAALSLGLPAPRAAAVGGGSDGNITAELGVPTLDGLGAAGGGAHADNEHVLITEMAPRMALLTALVSDLRRHENPGQDGDQADAFEDTQSVPTTAARLTRQARP